MVNVLLFISIVLISVTLHEIGHYIFAKLFNVFTNEFGIGGPPFGPKKVLFKIDGMPVVLRPIPIMGYVKVATEKEDVPSNMKNKFALEEISKIKQIFFLLSGVIMNYILAVFAFILAAIEKFNGHLLELFLRAISAPVLGMGFMFQLFFGTLKNASFTDFSNVNALDIVSQKPTIVGSDIWVYVFLINLSLIFFNLCLPIFGVTDGGKIILIVIEKIFGKHGPFIKQILTATGVFVFLLFVLVSCGADAFHLITRK